MIKSSVPKFESYYTKRRVVASYEEKRFKGFGGKYVDENETGLIVEMTKSYDREGRRVLDVGAGKGRLAMALRKVGFDVFCLDSSPEMIKILKKYFSNDRIFLQSAFDPININFKFDSITSLRFFDHLELENQKKVLENLVGYLEKRGFLTYSALNKCSLEALLSKYLSYGKQNYFYGDNDFRKVFKNLGLRVRLARGRFFLPRGVFLHLTKIPYLLQILILLDRSLSTIFPKFNSYLVYLLEFQ